MPEPPPPPPGVDDPLPEPPVCSHLHLENIEYGPTPIRPGQRLFLKAEAVSTPPSPGTTVTIRFVIKSSKGVHLWSANRPVVLDGSGRGKASATWSGQDSEGKALPPGDYAPEFYVLGKSPSGTDCQTWASACTGVTVGPPEPPGGGGGDDDDGGGGGDGDGGGGGGGGDGRWNDGGREDPNRPGARRNPPPFVPEPVDPTVAVGPPSRPPGPTPARLQPEASTPDLPQADSTGSRAGEEGDLGLWSSICRRRRRF